jgi:hypothetical protein
MSATRMIFRTVKAGEFKGSVDAVIVDAPANRGYVVCYAHVGQHSEGSREYFREKTRTATPRERSALVRELRGIYGPIRILKRWPRDAGRA